MHPCLLLTGHYGVVKIGAHKATGTKVAIKSVQKRRPVYVEMLRQELSILVVSWCAVFLSAWPRLGLWGPSHPPPPRSDAHSKLGCACLVVGCG